MGHMNNSGHFSKEQATIPIIPIAMWIPFRCKSQILVTGKALRAEHFPPGFPNGWHCVCNATDLADGRGLKSENREASVFVCIFYIYMIYMIFLYRDIICFVNHFCPRSQGPRLLTSYALGLMLQRYILAPLTCLFVLFMLIWKNIQRFLASIDFHGGASRLPARTGEVYLCLGYLHGGLPRQRWKGRWPTGVEIGPGLQVENTFDSLKCCREVGVVHAFCPHMGAHLGMGGMVVGNLLQCPFHGWSFDASGAFQFGHPVCEVQFSVQMIQTNCAVTWTTRLNFYLGKLS